MANIDNLNFKVIIDDSDFNRQIKQLEKEARRFNASMSSLLNIKKASAQIAQKEVEDNRRALQAAVDKVKAQEKINREKIKTEGLQKKINAQIERGVRGYQSQSRIMQDIKNLALSYLSVYGAGRILSSLVRVTGEFELQKTTLAAMLGDLNKAEQIITRIQGLAVKSPFQFKELTTYAKQLSAFSVPAEELYETTKMLADISAGLGVGMDRLVLAFGQVKSAAFLRGQEVRQFTEAGIPILEELAKQFEKVEGRAVSAGEVFDKISARLVPFEMVAKVLKDLTSEGGKFFNMQEVQASTLTGKISNLKDAYEIMLNEIGQGMSETMKDAVDWATNLIKNYKDTGRTIIELVSAYGLYRTALFLSNKMQKTFARNLVVLRKELSLTRKLMSINPSTGIAVGITAVIGLFYKLGKEMNRQSEIAESLRNSQEKLQTEFSKEINKLDVLKAKLELAKEGTEEYNSAISAIQREYAPYLEQLKEEGAQIDTLSGLYDNLKRKIEDAAHARFLAYARQDLDEAYTSKISDLVNGRNGYARSNLKDLVEELNLTQAEQTILQMYISGLVSWEEISEKYSELAKKISDPNNRVSLGPGDTGPVKAADYLETLKRKATGITKEYQDAILVIEEFAVAATTTSKEATQATSKFVETVQNTLSKFGATKDNIGIFGSLWADNDTRYYEYLEKIRKEYKDIQQKIKDVGTTQKSNLPDLEKQKEAIEAISKALGISLVEEAGNGKSEGQKRLEEQVDLVMRLQRAYEKLSPYIDSGAIKGLLSKYYPEAKKEWIESLDFKNILSALADELERYDMNAAESLRNSIKDSGVQDEVERLSELEQKYKESADAAKRYYEAIRKWKTSDFSIEGEGVALDIGKIANQLSTRFNEIELNSEKIAETFNQIDLSKPESIQKIKSSFEKEFGEGSWDVFYNEYITKGEQAIKQFADKEREYERKLAQERINDIAKNYVKESLENLDLSHWGDKSISQIEAIRQRISELMSGGIELPDSTLAKLKALGLSTDELIVKIKELFGEKYDTATIEKFKSLAKVINQASSFAKDLGSDLEELGNTLGNDVLKELGKSLQTFEELTKILTESDSLMQAFGKDSKKATDELKATGENGEKVANSSDLITVAFKLAATFISKVVNGVNESQEALIKAQEAAIKYANALKQIEYSNMMQSYETIFGTDEYRQAIEAMKAASKYRQDALDATKGIQTTTQDIAEALQMSAWANFSKGARETKKLVEELGLGDILVDARTGWQKFWGVGNDLISAININDFIDQGGMLKGEELREWLKQNGENISQDNKNTLEQMLNDYDLYVQAVEDATSYLGDIFGNIADDMADKFIEAFKASGEAALDYADIMDGVASELAKSVIKSILLENVFSPEKAKEVADLFLGGDKVGALSVVDEAMKAAQALTPEIQALLEELKPYFQMNGDAEASLGNGIKGITEDTANLLASYLNAIRADVSYSKTLWERMDANTQQIATILAGFSAPTLIDYQKKIEANTADIAFNTQRILSELQSVMTSEGGFTAIRTYS